jgi:hypothetical protein
LATVRNRLALGATLANATLAATASVSGTPQFNFTTTIDLAIPNPQIIAVSVPDSQTVGLAIPDSQVIELAI